MMTLKDIKISRNMIPVQNALWIRPIGGLSFEIYYPHGGEWQKMNLGDSPLPPGELDELVQEVNDLEERVELVEQDNSEILKRVARLGLRVSEAENRVDNLTISVEKLYRAVDITGIEFSKKPPIMDNEEDYELFVPSNYGIGELEWDAMLENKVVRAIIPGYDEAFKVVILRNTTPSAFIAYWFRAEIYLKEGSKRTYFNIVGTAQARVDAPLNILYYIDGHEQLIDENTVYFETEVPKETKSYSAEELAECGFSPAVLEKIYTEETTKLMMDGDMLEYAVAIDTAPGPETPYSGFYLIGYDRVDNKSYIYEVTGALEDETWSYDIVFNEESGDQRPEEGE